MLALMSLLVLRSRGCWREVMHSSRRIGEWNNHYDQFGNCSWDVNPTLGLFVAVFGDSMSARECMGGLMYYGCFGM